ncbi:hypothetical protein BC833DRAFT_595661 [Globomyces pollinis-pini]|nr:hypothetical protein BC833DRAFT_595661 [Globomyces pollinis-pini]
MRSTNELLKPFDQIIRTQLTLVKRLVENMKESPDSYNTDHFHHSLEFFKESLMGMRALCNSIEKQNWATKLYLSQQNRSEVDHLINSFKLASNSLQLGLQVDGFDRVMNERLKQIPTGPSNGGSEIKLDDNLTQLNNSISVKKNQYQSSVSASIAMGLNANRVDRDYYLEGYQLFNAAAHDRGAAFELFEKSRRLPESRYYLGICYLKGYGTAKNVGKAKLLLRRSWTSNQIPGAMLELGRLFEYEENNLLEAYAHYLTAAAFGLPRAVEKVVEIYKTEGPLYNPKEAERWEQKYQLLEVFNGQR